VNTISEPTLVDGRRRRRKHTDEFKAKVVAACSQPGVSIAAVSMAHGVNANLARRWVLDAERGVGLIGDRRDAVTTSVAPQPSAIPSFVPLQIAADTAASEIRVELRRGATTASVTWPTSAAAECAAWMRELLR
jgi:transposase